MSEAITPVDGGSGPADGAEGQQGTVFTQAEVDRIVGDRVTRERAKYADYDELKTKAGQATTAEERIAALEQKLSTTEASALRTRIAAKFSISTEPGKDDSPSDADLFLTGADEATLTKQAERLAGRVADRKKQGNVAPKEGTTSTSGSEDSELRETARQLFRRN